ARLGAACTRAWPYGAIAGGPTRSEFPRSKALIERATHPASLEAALEKASAVLAEAKSYVASETHSRRRKKSSASI
ncbi:MAG TPA: hypothetical protein VFE13_01830, partial [Caulobacteraceae bacterium]|nr:hypothetical protein [Caulobacteraceae bacterium]